MSSREGAKQLAAILDPTLANVDFNDGYIKASAEDTSGQQLRPDLAKDIFTYRLGPRSATEARVLRQAREVVEGRRCNGPRCSFRNRCCPGAARACPVTA